MSILDRVLIETPFVVIDVETTGLSPRHDRVVELGVVLVAPGDEPRVLIDTLINPGGEVSATEIHGIATEHVAQAPRFDQIASLVVAALANRVAVAHNASFDLAFLNEELARAGYAPTSVHLCTLALGRVLDPAAPPRSLQRAAMQYEIAAEGFHAAASDALVAAKVLRAQLRALRQKNVRTFDDLQRTANERHAFAQSFGYELVPAPHTMFSAGSALQPRSGKKMRPTRVGLAQYLDALTAALSDLHLDADERRELGSLPARLRLSEAEVRAAHARVFWAMLGRYVEDSRIDEIEMEHLHSLHGLLADLGWAPGSGS